MVTCSYYVIKRIWWWWWWWWLMTSRDQKRSRLWPQELWSSISQQPCEICGWFMLTTDNSTFGVQQSHDGWRHVTRKVKVMTIISLKLNISKTVLDRRSVLIDLLQETPYCESNGHMTDDVTWPQQVKVVSPTSLKVNILMTVWDTWSVYIETPHCECIGHFTDYITGPWTVEVVTPISLKQYFNNRAR